MLADSDDRDSHAGEEQPGPNREGGTTAALWRHLRPRLTRKLSAKLHDSPQGCLSVSSFSRDALQITTSGKANADSPPGTASALESAAGKEESAQAAFPSTTGRPCWGNGGLGAGKGSRYND